MNPYDLLRLALEIGKTSPKKQPSSRLPYFTAPMNVSSKNVLIVKCLGFAFDENLIYGALYLFFEIKHFKSSYVYPYDKFCSLFHRKSNENILLPPNISCWEQLTSCP